MPDSRPTPSDPVERTPGDRLDSWKEIAAYLRRDVTTVQRWEKREGMPVHRHLHDKGGSVYAFRAALDAWTRTRSGTGDPAAAPPADAAPPGADPAPERGAHDVTPGRPVGATVRRRGSTWGALAVGIVAVTAALGASHARRSAAASTNPLEDARFQEVTDFEGTEQAAAISRDGRFVAFQSDRDGRMDVWVTQLGTGEFANLTRGSARELVNPSVRTLGFSPDGTAVTFWVRAGDGGSAPGIGVWSATLIGGPARPYLEGVAEFDWSPDGARLVFHTPGPGDPMYVREPGEDRPRALFTAPPGLHAHFPLWSPDQAFIYFVQGMLPDHLDLWRIRPQGGAAERVTYHDAAVSHPVFLDGRTLLYLATDGDGLGPFIYSLDLATRSPRRVSFGADGYTSLSASADGRRLVATRATPKRTLWRVPVVGGSAQLSSARKVPLTTTNGSLARLGPGYLVYVAPTGNGDGLWRWQEGAATELWSEPDARVVGAPAVSPGGARIAFSARRGGRAALYVVNADGTGIRAVTAALELQGGPAWMPDGSSLTVAALSGGAPWLFDVPLDGRPPAPLVAEHAMGPAWSPAGDLVAYTGPDIGTKFELAAAAADGTAHRIAPLTLTRGARHVAFLPQGRSLLFLRGEIHHKDVWLVDLDTGDERPVARLAPGFDVRDFDVSRDGRELLLEQVQEHSDVVLVDRARR